MERTRYAGDDDKAVAPVLGGGAGQSVQPLYSTVPGAKSGPQSELRGVTVTIAALPSMTAEWLDRALECNSAKVTLGHAPDDARQILDRANAFKSKTAAAAK